MYLQTYTFLVNDQRDAQILFYVFISIYKSYRVVKRNKHIEETLCITLVIHQESLHDARSTKCKKKKNTYMYRCLNAISSGSYSVTPKLYGS